MLSLWPKLWDSAWIVTLGWWACSITIIEAVKHASHKSWLTVFGNLIVGWPLVAPLAFWNGWEAIKMHWPRMVLVAVLNALGINLGILSMYSIGAALGVAMGGFNMLFTFFVASLCGADDPGYSCVVKMRCFTRSNAILTLALLSLALGGVITAFLGNGDWNSSLPGVVMHLLSSVCYALKFTLVKLMFGDSHGGTAAASKSAQPSTPLPTKFQLAFFTNPVVGLVALGSSPMYDSEFGVPSARAVLAVACCGTLIMVSEFRLTELTSPLTVSVLASVHNVVIVLWFALKEREPLSSAQIAGFGVTSVGSLLYALGRHAPLAGSEGPGSVSSSDSDSASSSNASEVDD